MQCLPGGAAGCRTTHHRKSTPCAAAPQRQLPGRCRAAAAASPAAAMPAGVRRLAPHADMDATEQAIKVIGEAFVMHNLHRQLQTRLGKEQNVFAGLSRMMLDSFEEQPVLLITQCGSGAAVLLHSFQFASLAADVQATPTPFSLTPGSLQMLTCIPQDSLPIMMQEVQQVYEAGLAAMQQVSSSSSSNADAAEYLQLAIIGVTPAQQGKGLGRLLLQAAVAVAEQEQLPLLVQAAGDGVAEFYGKSGLTTIGRRGVHPLMLWESP